MRLRFLDRRRDPGRRRRAREASLAFDDPAFGAAAERIYFVIVEDDRVGEASCLRLRGLDSGGLPVTVWLDSGTYLIRRIDEELPERFGAVQATLYEPAVDGAVEIVPLEAPRDAVGIPGLVVAVPAVVLGVILVVRWRRNGTFEWRTGPFRTRGGRTRA
jgi:hypothetical protein